MKKYYKRLLAVALMLLTVLAGMPSGLIVKKVQAAANPNFKYVGKEYHSTKQVGIYNDYNVDSGTIFTPQSASGKLPVVIFLHGAGGKWPDTPNSYYPTVEKWIKDGYFSPFALLMPNMTSIGFDAYVTCDLPSIGGERELMGELVSRIENGTFDSLTGVTLDKDKLTICGYSMGGGVAVLGGSYYRDKFVNVGSFSQCPQTHYPTNQYEDWMDKYEKTSDYGFTNRKDRHMFMACSAAETDCLTSVNDCYDDFGAANDFARVIFASGSHNKDLFLKEFFCFLYYVQYDAMPSDEVMMAALGLSSIPARTTTMPERQDVTPIIGPEGECISGSVTLNATSFAYKFCVSASVSNCNATSLAYQWFRDYTPISGATHKDYILAEADIGQKITCVVSDKTGTLKNSINATTPAIQKSSGPLAPTGLSMTPCTPGKSNGRIGRVTAEMEYATGIDFKNARTCPNGAITGLAAGTYYVRYKETATTKAGYAEKITITESLSDADLQIAKKALQLQDTIAIQYKVPKSAIGSKYHAPYLNVTQGGTVTKLADYVDDGTYLVFTYRTVPQTIGEDAGVALYALNANGQTVAGEVIAYSVAQYCYNMLGKETYQSADYATFRRLLVDILYYGDAAQEYMNYQTDALASRKLTKAQRAMGTDLTAEMRYNNVKDPNYATVSASAGKANITSAALYLESAVNVRFKFEASSLSNLTIVVSDGTKELKRITPKASQKDANGKYYVDFDGLNAGEMKKTIYATVMEGNKKVSNTYRYSIESYVAGMKGTREEIFDILLDSMMRYGNSAADYVAQY
ncbi:MAG: esterase family protein [Acetatifactor sp.]|nr:esterase family protein [Acetatifactor sp.]